MPDSCFDSQGQPRALANNSTCLIAYHYTPKTLGLLTTQLQVAAAGSTQVSQTITSTVEAPKGLQATYIPTEASDWSGITGINTPLNVCFEYRNAGTSTTSLTLSHTGANITKASDVVGCPAALTSPVCSSTLAAGARCSVRYVYNANTKHSVQAVFTAKGDSKSIVNAVDLAALPPNVVSVVGSQSSDLPQATPYVAPLKQPTYVTATFINHSAKPVGVSAVIGRGDPSFRTITNECVGPNGKARTLQPNEECVVTSLLDKPTTSGIKTLMLTLYEDDGDTATWTGTVNVKALTVVSKEIATSKDPLEAFIAPALVQLTYGTLVAGTINGNSSLLASIDSGANWTSVANFPLSSVGSLVFSNGVLYAAGSGVR